MAKARILVVDDEANARAALRAILSEEGYEIDEAADGEAGLEKLERVLPFAEAARLTPIQLACQWNLAHPAVECVVPTLIQEAHADACPIEAKRVELAALPAEQRLSEEEVTAIR